MKRKTQHTLINIGSGKDYSIKYYANLILKLIIPNKKIVIKYDKSKPNGDMKRLMSMRRAHELGFNPRVKLKDGIEKTIEWYLNL